MDLARVRGATAAGLAAVTVLALSACGPAQATGAAATGATARTSTARTSTAGTGTARTSTAAASTARTSTAGTGTARTSTAGTGTARTSTAGTSTAATSVARTTAAAAPAGAVRSGAVRSGAVRSTAARTTPARTSAARSGAVARSASAAAPAVVRPVIVIDPGHSLPIHAIDPGTGLNVSDYPNEPEMRDVFAVAQLVRARLLAAGYRVVMTKTSVNQRVSLGRRAAIANRAHAALALSIHDQAGWNGGIGFDRGNNTVYYQSVGDYRATPSGRHVVFTNRRVAALSRKYGRIFRTRRAAVERHPVRLLGNVGYNLGSRGLAPGNIWLVQLLSHVPWIYNEAGGNSAGRSGLNPADRHRYAAGLVAAVEACIRPPR